MMLQTLLTSVNLDSCDAIHFNIGRRHYNIIEDTAVDHSCCRLPLKFCFIKVPVCMAAQLGPLQKQGDYGTPRLVFENNQSGLWRGSLVIFSTRTATSLTSPCSCILRQSASALHAVFPTFLCVCMCMHNLLPSTAAK